MKNSEAFIKDIIEVYKKHGLCIGQEDKHSGFKILPFDDGLVRKIEWAFNGPKRIAREKELDMIHEQKNADTTN
jgi:hypothetical protein